MASVNFAVELAMMAIERFEKSTKLKEDSPSGNLSVRLMDNRRYMSDKDYEYRLKMNETAISMERENLLKIKWYEKNNIIERFSFNLDNLDNFYRLTQTEKKVDSLQNALTEVRRYQHNVKAYWIRDYFEEVANEIMNNKRLPAVLKEEEKRPLIYGALVGIDELLSSEGLILERIFSKKYLKNSKVFEKEIRGVVLGIVKKHCPGIDSSLSPEEILIEVGIEKTTTELFIKGALLLKCGDATLDLTNFPYGTALNTQTIRQVSIMKAPIRNVISIENKANYLNACERAEKDELIIFSSGYYNPSQRKFLSRLRDYLLRKNSGCRFYHSGDLDFGGFNIFNNIKSQIIPELLPMNMSKPTFLSFLEFAEDIKNDEYKDKLKKLLLNDEYAVFHELIECIIEENKVLEQEAFLF